MLQSIIFIIDLHRILKVYCIRVYRISHSQGLVNSCVECETCNFVMFFARKMHLSISGYYGFMNFFSDCTWMAWRKSNSEIGATTEFRATCQVFLEYAYSHLKCVNDRNHARCPYWKCKTYNYPDINIINYHFTW